MSVVSFLVKKSVGELQATAAPSKLFMFPHPLAWVFAGLLIMLDMFFLVTKGFMLEAGPIWPILSLAAISLIVALGIQRHYSQIAMVAFTFAFFVITGKAMRVLNYVTTSLAKPFITPRLDEIDKWLGFDWLQYLTWVNESSILPKILPGAYDSLSVTTLLTIYILVVMRRHEKLREFLILFFMLAFVTTTIGWFFPVEDTFSFYQPSFDKRSNIRELAGVFHLPHFTPLREGTMKYINLSNMVGMVQFPSFHTIAGLLIIWATRGSLMVIPMAVVNLTMIIAAVVYGGHYLIDIIISTTLVVGAIVLYQAFKSTGWAWQVRGNDVSKSKQLNACQPE